MATYDNSTIPVEKTWFNTNLINGIYTASGLAPLSVIETFFGSNYYKHGNYVAIDNNKVVYKVYQNKSIYDDALARYNFIKTQSIDVFTVPDILAFETVDGKFIIKLKWVEYGALMEEGSFLSFLKDCFDTIKSLSVSDDSIFQSYELKNDYKDLFSEGSTILTHGDLHNKNVIGERHLIDWDNLSLKNERLEIGTIVYLHLSRILSTNSDISLDKFDENVTQAKSLFGNDCIFYAYTVGTKKALISVDENHVNTFEKTNTKLKEVLGI